MSFRELGGKYLEDSMETRRKSGLSRCGFGFGQQLADEDEMVGWHHRLNGHEFEQTLGDSEGQGSLACCSPWSLKDLNMA